MAITETTTEGRFAKALLKAMSDKNVDIRGLSRATNTSYEHVRKLVRGEALPSPWMVLQIAEVLQLDREELDKLAVADRIEKRFGTTAQVLGGKDPEAVPVMNKWRRLTDEQRTMVDAMMDGLIAQNTAHAPKKRRA